MVTFTVSPGVSPVMSNEKKPCGKIRFGFPAMGRVDSGTAIGFSIVPELTQNPALPVPVAVANPAEDGVVRSDVVGSP